jgi:hypothetical protein
MTALPWVPPADNVACPYCGERVWLELEPISLRFVCWQCSHWWQAPIPERDRFGQRRPLAALVARVLAYH